MIVNETRRIRVKARVELSALLRLPTKGRKERGQNLKCDACGEQIEDEHFLGGFAPGHRNMLLHEACVPAEDRARLLRRDADHG